MAKVAFVCPDNKVLGVEYLMAVCIKDGHEVEYFHYHCINHILNKRVDEAEKTARLIADAKPQIAAFSCLHYNYLDQLRCARILKEIFPSIVTVFGGVHPTSVPEKVIAEDAVDCAVIGEAEVSFRQFLKQSCINGEFMLPETPVEGIVFKKNGKVLGEYKEGSLADLNELPYPHSSPYYELFNEEKNIYPIMTSRGCPNTCSYCLNSLYHRLRGSKKIRRRGVSNVIDELKWAQEKFRYKYVRFYDDSFTSDKTWLEEFCAAYKKEIGKPFYCCSIPQYMDEEKARWLASAGCLYMQMGIQSHSQELCLKMLNRRSSNERIAQAISAVKKARIFIQVDHMLGIPGDTHAGQEASIEFYNRHRPDCIIVFWLTYYPGTAIVESALNLGVITEQDKDNLENGRALTDKNYHMGGSMPNPKSFYSIALMLNYLPVIPAQLVSFLVRTRLYRLLGIENYYISTALPRAFIAIFNKNNFIDRMALKRAVRYVSIRKRFQ